jgi:hypothetical protein
MSPVMMRTFLFASLCSLAACSHSTTSPTTSSTSPVPARGKPSAPVRVTAEVGAQSAHVTVTFESDARDVNVRVHGVDGLAVDGELAPVKGRTFARGESASFSVLFAPPSGRATLVVSVSGTFGSAKRARVAAFSVGEGPVPETPGEVMTTDDGDTVKVMPAAPQ